MIKTWTFELTQVTLKNILILINIPIGYTLLVPEGGQKRITHYFFWHLCAYII